MEGLVLPSIMNCEDEDHSCGGITYAVCCEALIAIVPIGPRRTEISVSRLH